MSFGVPAKIKPNTSYKSAPFYAIILKDFKQSGDDCDGGEYTRGIESLCHAVFVAATTDTGLENTELIHRLRKIAGWGFDPKDAA